jgi:trimeric autotransporter adhesin
VLPATFDLLVGSTRVLAAQARAASGSLITGRTVTWTSGATSIATVSSSGVVNALGEGVVVIAATVDGITGFATLTVQERRVATMLITPAAPEVLIGAQLQLTATPRDGLGAPIAGRPITWSSSNEAVAFVSSSGTVIGVSAGTATITATLEGVSANIIVTVR